MSFDAGAGDTPNASRVKVVKEARGLISGNGRESLNKVPANITNSLHAPCNRPIDSTGLKVSREMLSSVGISSRTHDRT